MSLLKKIFKPKSTKEFQVKEPATPFSSAYSKRNTNLPAALNCRRILFLVILTAGFSGCSGYKKKEKTLKESVSVNFRCSYGGGRELSDAEWEAIAKRNPGLDYISPQGDSMILNYLQNIGLIDSSRLLVKKIEGLVKDTIYADFGDGDKAKLYCIYDGKTESRALRIESRKAVKEIKIDAIPPVMNLMYLDAFKTFGPRIIIYNPYYFMNGDMYTLIVFDFK